MKPLKGYTYGHGPIVLPNATAEQKEALRQKGVKVADVDDIEAERLKREIANR